MLKFLLIDLVRMRMLGIVFASFSVDRRLLCILLPYWCDTIIKLTFFASFDLTMTP